MSTGTSSIEKMSPACRISPQSSRWNAKWCSLPCGPSITRCRAGDPAREPGADYVGVLLDGRLDALGGARSPAPPEEAVDEVGRPRRQQRGRPGRADAAAGAAGTTSGLIDPTAVPTRLHLAVELQGVLGRQDDPHAVADLGVLPRLIRSTWRRTAGRASRRSPRSSSDEHLVAELDQPDPALLEDHGVVVPLVPALAGAACRAPRARPTCPACSSSGRGLPRGPLPGYARTPVA